MNRRTASSTPPPSPPAATLAQALQTLRGELAAEQPPPLRPRRRAAPLHAAPSPVPAPRRFGRLAWAGAVFCVAVLAASAVLMSLARAPGAEETMPLSGFVPLTPFEQWTRADGSADTAWLVPTELPHAQLAALGLPYDPARAGEAVPAQLLMRPSGEVLAVRLLR